MTINRLKTARHIVLLLIIVISSCNALAASSLEPKHAYVMGNQSLVLSEVDQKTLESQALMGSADAAMRLYGFYEYVCLNHEESLFWVQIAAENGDPVGQYNFASMLLDKPNPRNRQRARFWLERAARNGDNSAEDLLKEFQE